MTMTTERGIAPGTRTRSAGRAAAAAAAPKKVKLPREQDPRNPNRRLQALLDAGSIELITPDDDSGMLAATGTINGCRVVAFCSDATVMGGAMGMDGCDVVVRAYERAMHDRVPILGIWHSGGARLAEGVLSLHGVGRIFHAMTQASGKIPQISIVLGFAAGGAAYGPALTDLVILAPEGRIFVTGPDVVRSVTGEDVDMLRLGRTGHSRAPIRCRARGRRRRSRMRSSRAGHSRPCWPIRVRPPGRWPMSILLHSCPSRRGEPTTFIR